MALQRIDVTNGMVAYLLDWEITNNKGVDLSGWASTVRLGLGTDDVAPTQWFDPNDPAVGILTQPAPNKIMATILVGGAYKPAVGTYRQWRTISPNPEVLPIATPLQVVIL